MPETDLPDDSPAVVLVLPSGDTVRLTGTGLLGRAPRSEPTEYLDALVRLRDAGRSVSKTHLEWGFDAAGFWVMDRWSVNGTVLVSPEGEPRRCEPGRRMHAVAGEVLRLGVIELRIGEA